MFNALIYFKLFILLLLLLVFLSGCEFELKDWQGKLRWLDNKVGEIFKELPQKESTQEEPKDTGQPTAGDFTIEQKEDIDAWLSGNNYNRYGDPIDTIYTGGTPLFNEATGESLERFSYILGKHPDILEKIKEQ